MNESKDFDEVFMKIRDVGKKLGVDKAYPWDKLNINRTTLTSFGAYFQIFVFSTAFLKFRAVTSADYTESFYMSFTSVGSAVNLIFLIWKTKEVHELMCDIEHTYRKRSENPISKRIYKEMNENIERATNQFYVGLVQITSVGTIIPSAIISYYRYFILDQREESFELAIHMILPFNHRNPYLYVIAFFIQLYTFVYVLYGCVYNMSFHVALKYAIKAFARDIRQELYSLNEVNAGQEDQKSSKELLGEMVRVHGKMKQFVADFADIYYYVFTACLSWCLITICSILITVQLELNATETNYSVWLRALNLLFWSFGKAYILCEHSHEVTIEFERLNHDINQLDWWSFPLGIQRMLPFVISNSQKPVIIRSFGNFECCRYTFKQIASGGISYFITIRQFT